MIDSKKNYSEWLFLADQYYLAPRNLYLFVHGPGDFTCSYLAHFSLELYLKGILVKESNKFLPIHKLDKLYEKLFP